MSGRRKVVRVDDLVDAATAAQRLGVEQRTIHAWRSRHTDFPQPIVQFTRVAVWDYADIERWARRTGRLS